jgi:hypothetical protein
MMLSLFWLLTTYLTTLVSAQLNGGVSLNDTQLARVGIVRDPTYPLVQSAELVEIWHEGPNIEGQLEVHAVSLLASVRIYPS